MDTFVGFRDWGMCARYRRCSLLRFSLPDAHRRCRRRRRSAVTHVCCVFAPFLFKTMRIFNF